MALFRRRSADVPEDAQTPAADAADNEESVDAEPTDQLTEAEDEAAEGADEDAPTTDDAAAFDRSDGPFDETESDKADSELLRLDLGSLRIPGLPGVSVQLEADEATQQVHAVTAIAGEAAVQLRAFAAPRSEGMWDDLRAETLQEIRATAGARVTDGVGAFGAELRALVPARSPEGKQVRQLVRFAGVDGPRWFLQVVFLGKAAAEPDPTDELHRLVRQTIVVRGTEAMAPGQPLGLTLPAQPPQSVEGAEEDGQADAEGEGESGPRYSGIDPFTRGPEITEVR